MTQVIVYNDEEGVAVTVPTPDCLQTHSILEIAIKDVPAGKPFKIMHLDDLPLDVPQEAWEIDDAELTDGVGGELSVFPTEDSND